MKRFRILHRTYYNFSAPVTLGTHQLRLRPRESHELRIEASTLAIEPAASLRWLRDAENNSVAIASFSEPAQQLAIESDVIVQQWNVNPYNFLIDEDAAQWPFRYRAAETAALMPYLQAADAQADFQAVSRWLDDSSREAIAETFARLQALNEKIRSGLSYRIRDEAGVQSPHDTLSLGSGACRDFAALFIAAARQMGFAARFVSGYLRADAAIDNLGATHAWAEVYLPGAGWKGFDPTLAQLAGPDHFAVAVARTADAVPPISGAYTGNATSRLEVGVWVTELPAPP
ncbi:MAG TPA: transglutaminase family protein [Fontimonas sp.]